MSPPGRPKGECRSAQHEGAPQFTGAGTMMTAQSDQGKR